MRLEAGRQKYSPSTALDPSLDPLGNARDDRSGREKESLRQNGASQPCAK
jgi:hypothetical protein